jgi:hypothetical protein
MTADLLLRYISPVLAQDMNWLGKGKKLAVVKSKMQYIVTG